MAGHPQDLVGDYDRKNPQAETIDERAYEAGTSFATPQDRRLRGDDRTNLICVF